MSSGHATVVGYTIEARSVRDPVELMGQLLGERWAAIVCRPAVAGVPNPIWNSLAQEQGILAYSTATSLMGWAAASAGFSSGVEFRLVKKVLKYDYTIEREGVGEPVNFWNHERAAKFAPEPKEDA